MKKIFGYIMLVLFIAGSICGIVFGIMWHNNEKYIEENSAAIEQAVELKEQIKILTNDKNELVIQVDSLQELDKKNKETIDAYKVQLEAEISAKNEANEEIIELISRITDLEEEKDELESQAEIDEAEIARINGLLNQANADKENLQNEVSQKESTINSLNETVVDLEESNLNLQNTITSLNEQIVSLQNTITSLEAELEAYEDMNLDDYNKVEFVNDETDLIVSSMYVKKGQRLDNIPTIKNTADVWFYGWATTEESEELVDFSNYIVNEDITFYSVFGETVMLDFEINDYDNEIYYVGANLKVKDILIYDNSLDLDDENLNIEVSTNGSYQVTLDSLITELGKGSGFQIDGEMVYSYKLIVTVTYHATMTDGDYSLSSRNGTTSYSAENLYFNDFANDGGFSDYNILRIENFTIEITYISDSETQLYNLTDYTTSFGNYKNVVDLKNFNFIFNNEAGLSIDLTIGLNLEKNNFGYLSFSTNYLEGDTIKLSNLSFDFYLNNLTIRVSDLLVEKV